MNTKVTMYTIANELNLSVAAVSRAFNPDSKLNAEKRKLILATAERMGYVPNKMASRLSQATINIGALIYGYMDAYDVEIISGIESAYRELQGYKVECDIRHLRYGESTLEDAISVIDEFIANGYDGILLTTLPDDEEFIDFTRQHSALEKNKLNELSEKNIKVAFFDEDIPNCDRLFVSMNNISVTAKMASQLLKDFIPDEEKNIAVFYSGKYDLLDTFCKNAESSGLDIAITAYLELSRTEASAKLNADVIDSVFSAYPQINGVYVNYADCLPVCKYLEEHGKGDEVVFIVSDIYDEMRPYIENGVINASIYQDPFSQGYNAFKNMYFHLAEKQVIPEHVLAHPQIILKSNMELF